MPSLITCKACGASVSKDAAACPKCGHPLKRSPKPRSGNSGCAVVILVVLGLFLYGLIRDGGSNAPVATQAPQTPQPPSASCLQDLHCIGEKLSRNVDVIIACKHRVAAQAKNDAKWDDGILSPPFAEYAWQSGPGSKIVLLGDRVQFQNGFGNFLRMSYACTVDPADQSIDTVRVFQGKLPG